ncbi:MAG: efflux transporter outer membrane subunit [Rhodocyclaceae bacterium]|nr:efflux transporter outer membrane subunit [Rhodocyclaceae bacterium]
MRTFFLLTTGLTILCGCALKSVPTIDLQQLAPSEWNLSDPAQTVDLQPLQAQQLGEFWRRFSDPVLSQLINTALLNSSSLQQARARLDEATALASKAQAELSPTLTAELAYQREKIVTVLPNQSRVTNTVSNTNVAGYFRWEIDIFGAKRAAQAAAEADLGAAQADLQAAHASLACAVAEVYVEWRGLYSRLSLWRHLTDSLTAELRLPQAKVDVGLATVTDANLVSQSLAQTQAQMSLVPSALSAAEARLAALTGFTPGHWRQILESSADRLKIPSDMSLGIPLDVLERRRDVAVAALRLHAAVLRSVQADAERYPQLALAANSGWQAPRLTDLGGANTLTYQLLTQLSATIFDAGRLEQALRVQQARQAEKLALWRQTVLEALKEVSAEYATVQGRTEAARARFSAASEAARRYQLIQARAQVGLLDELSVMNTARTRWQAELDAAQAEQERRQSAIRLVRALGGGWVMQTQESR